MRRSWPRTPTRTRSARTPATSPTPTTPAPARPPPRPPATCPPSRTPPGKQLDAIRESRGLVGVNFATAFIRPDGRRDADTPLIEMIRHIDHLIEKVGVDGVGFGSDFDGATVPLEIGDARGLPRLVEAMGKHGDGAGSLRGL